MNEQSQAIQAMQNASRGFIQQLQKESAQHQESNTRLAGQLQRYADAYQRMKAELEQLKAVNKSQETNIGTLRADNKTLSEQVRVLMSELTFLLNQAQMLSTEVASGDSQILDSTTLLDSIYDEQVDAPKPVIADLSVDLAQTLTSYDAPSAHPAPETLDVEGGLVVDMDAIEAELAEIEGTAREAA
jgi:chromosome segregation ATPase